jgi:adenylylsulfate kinase
MQVREQCGCGVTLWITGPPDADIPALARALAGRLRGTGRRVAVLDGEHTPRAGLTAEVLARNGVITLVSAPDQDAGTAVRERHVSSGAHFLAVRITSPSAAHAYDAPHSADLVIPTHTQATSSGAALLMELLAKRHFVQAGT